MSDKTTEMKYDWLNRQPEVETVKQISFMKIVICLIFGVVLIFTAFLLEDKINEALSQGGIARMEYWLAIPYKIFGAKGLFYFMAGSGILLIAYSGFLLISFRKSRL